MLKIAYCARDKRAGVQVGKELPDLHTGRSPTQSDIYQMFD
jgi:hypothetical protein